MTRGTVTKILLLVILAFIICLPEFFRIYSVSKVNFHCLPHQPSGESHQQWKGNWRPGKGEDERKAICDPPSSTEDEQWEQIYRRDTQRNTTNLHAETQGVQADSTGGWFICETDKNMDEFRVNVSSTAVVILLELSVTFQLNNKETVNLTLYGRSNHSSLYFQLVEEEEDPMSNDENQGEAFYCCLPLVPTSNSANQSPCLLWLANQTTLTGPETERLPWKRAVGWCWLRMTCLVLLCVVFLIVVAAVTGKIYVGKRINKNPIVLQIDNYSSNQQSKGTANQSSRLQYFSRLSPIPEIEHQEDNEILLHRNGPNHCSENPSSSLPSSYLLPHRRTGVLTDAQQKEHRNGLKAIKQKHCITSRPPL